MSSTANRVELDHDWWGAQQRTLTALHSGDYDLVVFRGGFGSGKTLLGTRWVIRTALRVAKSDNLAVAPDAQKGGPTTYKALFEELPGENTIPDEGGDPENSPIVAEYHAVERRLTLKNGSVIRLGSADKWNRYAGGEFNAIYCDEVAHYDTTDLYDLHEMLISRQRTAQGPNVTLWTSTGNGYNQFYDITERQVTPDDEPLPWSETMQVIQADSRNNPFLNETGKLRRQFEGTARAEQALAGGFAAAQGLVYPSFSRTTHVVDAGDIRDRLVEDRALYGYDAGWDDPRVVVDIRRTHADQYVVWDCYYESESRLAEVVDPDDVLEERAAWMEGRPKGGVYAEHEPAHIQQFRKAGWPATKAEKSLDGGIDHVRDRLATDVEGRPGLLVTARCADVIQEFLSYKEEHVGKAAATDHALDAIRYALFTHTPATDTVDDDTSGVSYL